MVAEHREQVIAVTNKYTITIKVRKDYTVSTSVKSGDRYSTSEVEVPHTLELADYSGTRENLEDVVKLGRGLLDLISE